MSKIGKRLIRSLKKFNRDLKAGDLSGYEITRVTREEDGTYKHTRLKLKGGRGRGRNTFR